MGVVSVDKSASEELGDAFLEELEQGVSGNFPWAGGTRMKFPGSSSGIKKEINFPFLSGISPLSLMDTSVIFMSLFGALGVVP